MMGLKRIGRKWLFKRMVRYVRNHWDEWTDAINNKVDIPYLDDEQEEWLFEHLLDERVIAWLDNYLETGVLSAPGWDDFKISKQELAKVILGFVTARFPKFFGWLPFSNEERVKNTVDVLEPYIEENL